MSSSTRSSVPRLFSTTRRPAPPRRARSSGSRNNDTTWAASSPGIVNDPRRTVHDQQLGDVGSVEEIRPGQHGQAERRRLEQVVAADRRQAAGDERDIGARVEHHQFTHAVAEEYGRRGAAARTLLVTAASAQAQGLDWEVEERADAPAPVRVLRNVRDGVLGHGDAFFDLNTAAFGGLALAASQIFIGASDVVGLVDDNPLTQYVTKGVVSKNLAKVAYLWHLAGAESLLGSHGLEKERWATSAVAGLNPLLADEDVAALEGPLPLDPLAFVGEATFHTETYRPHAPFTSLGAAVLVDVALRPTSSLLRFAQLPGHADALDDRAARLYRRTVEWGW